MAVEVPIVVPHETVNDETVKLIRWLVEDGQRVSEGESVAEVEGSKATFDVPCPQAGIICRRAAVGEEIPVGAPLCHVIVAEETENPQPSANGIAPVHLPVPTQNPPHQPRPVLIQPLLSPIVAKSEVPSPPISQRFSTAARQLIRQHNLDTGLFGNLSLVRAPNVRAYLARSSSENRVASTETSLEMPPTAVSHASNSRYDVVPLSRQKMTEIRYLRQGGANVIASQVSSLVPTVGLRDALLRGPDALSLTALIVFETARLLRRYPNLNAVYTERTACHYRDVNIGFAVAGEFGLKVPVIHQADQKPAGRIAEDIRTLLAEYASNSLTPEQLAGGTFTVSDLSGEGVFTLNPLIVQGQAAILGVGAETRASGDGEQTFSLTLSFDHQLADGLQAAQFLTELRTRLRHHEATLRQRTPPPTCARCNRTVGEIQQFKGHLLQTLSESGGIVRVCSSCIAGF